MKQYFLEIMQKPEYQRYNGQTKSESKRNYEEAATGFFYTMLSDKTQGVKLIEADTDKKTEEALVTFTRYGEQEFANGEQPWWDTMK